MARISTYQRDTVITKDDKVIGSDFNGSVTKNFNLGDLSNFFSSNITVAGQLSYIFKDYLGDGIITNITDNAAFSSLTAFKVSEIDAAGHNIQNFLQEYINKKIILVQVDNKNNYGIYDVGDIIEDENNLNYYDFSLNYASGNGNLILNKYYLLAIFAEGDKHKELSFTTNTFEADTEVINGSTMRYFDFTHNLNKYPAITATEVGSEDQVAYVPVKYINKNTVRVYFTGITNGKIYAN